MHLDYYTNITRNPGHVKRKEAEGGGRRRPRRDSETERERMFARQSHMDGYKPYAAYGNFILVRILKEGLTSFDVFEAAIKNRLMIRDCSSFESLTGEYIRFCIMNPEDNDRLLHVLNSLI